MKRNLMLLVVFLIGLPVHASKIIGNGGNVVVCGDLPQVVTGTFGTPAVRSFTSTIPPVSTTSHNMQLLDFYEAQELYGLKIQDPGGTNEEERLANLMVRVKARFPKLATALQVELGNFFQHQRLLPNVELESTVDSFHSVLPRGCKIQQIANQIPTGKPEFPRAPWFIINKDLWDNMDDLNRAGLALHEALYRIGARNGAEQSRGIRYVVGMMFSTEIDTIDDENWISGFMGARIRNYETMGVSVPLFSNDVLPCTPEPGATTCEQLAELRPAQMRFDDNGRLTLATYERPRRMEFSSVENDHNVDVVVEVSQMKFSRYTRSLRLTGTGTLELKLANSPYSVGPVRFDFSGEIDPSMGSITGKVAREKSILSDVMGMPLYGLLSAAVLSTSGSAARGPLE